MEVNPKIVIELLLLVIILVIIVAKQISTYRSTKQRLSIFKEVFPKDSISSIKLDKNPDTEFVQGVICDYKNEVLDVIISSTNRYLQSLKGTIADFQIIKDIVDRNSDSVENEIDSQIPMPLYYGLMGTMAGIIIGVGSLLLSGAISGTMAKNAGLRDPIGRIVSAEGIVSLLLGVALAMIASIIGIILTTRASRKAKEVKVEVEQSKNDFLSWLQANLLPELSSDAASAIQRLAENLSSFNNTFASNNQELQRTLEVVRNSTKGQGDLIEKISRLNISEIASANVRVYDHLKNSAEHIGQFGQYVNNINDYLTLTKDLIEKLDASDRRTQLIEDMAEFFKKERSNIAMMDAVIQKSIGQTESMVSEMSEIFVDNVIRKFDTMSRTIDACYDTFEKSINEKNGIVLSVIDEEKRNISLLMSDSAEIGKNAIAAQSELVKSAMAEREVVLDKLVEELQSLRPLSKVMSDIASDFHELKNLNSSLRSVVDAIENAAFQQTGDHIPQIQSNQTKDSLWIKLAVGITCVIVSTVSIVIMIRVGL